MDGSLTILTQCATGRSNWQTKRGDPAFTAWQGLLQWNSVLVRAIAIPWRLEGQWTRARAYQYFDAIVLDRPRLAAGHPDFHLDAAIGADLNRWCAAALRRLPSLN